MKTKIILALLGLVSSIGVSQNTPITFSLLRQYDKVDTLKNNKSKNTYQNFKNIPISEHTNLSFGGSWRFQYESFSNEQFQNIPDQNNLWYLNRVMLHAHLKVKDKFQLFTEVSSSSIGGKDNQSPVDKDELAINQLFIKYKFNDHWSIGVGRENLILGSNRLVDLREGPNVRRAFDLTQVNYHSNNFSAKAFFAIPVKPNPYVFDNDFLEFDETLSALYTTISFNKSNYLDAYVFYQKDDNVNYNNAQGNERRTSLGFRYFGNYKSLRFNNEAVYQFGDIENQSIQAWTLSVQLENSTKLGNHLYNIGVKSEMISGDKNQNDNRLNTFDALYPSGAYFGRVARFGPSNLIDLHPYINTKFKKLFIEFDYDVFWRYSLNDGVYNAALLLEYPNTNNQRFIGQQIGTIVGYKLNKHINLEFESNIIFPGAFLKQSNQGDTLYHFVFTTEIKF
ncbi:MAG: alginate export family protein [Psychroserpens sp.]|uniref:alginate export family protein n=1 Tax=Psychroserpens sp. TaxID=2020870 RepID=UPI0030011345